MLSFKVLAAVAVAGLVSAGAAAASVPAHIAGGDAGPPLYPSIVNVRLVRTEAALQRAVEYVDTAQADKAIAQLTLARTQMRKAWTGAKYVIDTAPPPVAGSGAFGRASGNPVGASPYADQYTTAGGVLSLQHDVATTAIGLLDSASGTLQASLSSTIFAALNTRDTAIAYIHTKDVPAAPAGLARASAGRAPAARRRDAVRRRHAQGRRLQRRQESPDRRRGPGPEVREEHQQVLAAASRRLDGSASA